MLNDCHILELPKVSDPRGNLTFIEESVHVPFDIKRVYYLYDVPGGAERGAHGHQELRQMIVPLAGSFDIHLDDGIDKEIYHMNTPNKGLFVSPMMWRDITNFSSGAVCLVLASELYSETDYFRDYEEFLRAIQATL